MPSANPRSTPLAVDEPFVQARYAELDAYTVGFESYPQDVAPAPFFVGLPDDRCQCPHWGVVTAGQATFRYADHDETFRAGDAYFAPPGHRPLLAAGTTLVEFSPTDALARTTAVVEANLTAVAS